MAKKMNLTYRDSGVNYNFIDPVKKYAQKMGLLTGINLKGSGFKEFSASRGESAYVIENRDCYFASVIEGLGTKNLLADGFRGVSQKSYYDFLAMDTVAAIVNDLATVGAKPLVVNAYWAVGNSLWFKDKKRFRDLVNGWKKACDESGVAWGGGETPVLNGIIAPDSIDLGGSAFGIIKPKKRLLTGSKIKYGDAIIMLASNGIHANGLTLARSILSKLKQKKRLTQLLLQPSFIYAKVVQAMLNRDLDIHYLINITGHGWRKLMRYPEPFTYMIDNVGDVPEVFRVLKKAGNMTHREMYSTFNMGAGFAVIASRRDAFKIIDTARKFNIDAWLAGKVLKGEKTVNIIPTGIKFGSRDLNIRN